MDFLKRLDESKPMTNFRVRIQNVVFGKMKRNVFWNNERGCCCFGEKKQGIRFAVEAVEMIGYHLGVSLPQLYLVPDNYSNNFDILKNTGVN